MIEIKNLSYKYKQDLNIQFQDFSIDKGEHCLLLGESGSGKTTLLHVLGGLLRNYEGKVTIADVELSSLSEFSLDHFRGQKIGFIFQKNHLISALTVEKNLAMAPYLAGRSINSEKINSVLQRLGLFEKRKVRVTQISQGQAQRVAIARAVLNNPAVILADEPTSALDDKNCEQVVNLLLEVAKENKATLVIATHDQRLKNKFNKQINLTSTLQPPTPNL